jgi:hypothetical protein
MASLSALWRWATEQRAASLGICAAVVAVGVLLIAIGEVAEWGWTRLIGAGLISIGSVLAGVLVGWSEPVRPRIADALRHWSRALVLVLAAIIVAPLLAGLLLGLGGMVTDDASDDVLLLVVGIAIIVLMLAITAVTVWLALSLALRSLGRSPAEQNGATNGQEEA